MRKKIRLLLTVVLAVLVTSANIVFAFQVTVQNMVGLSSGTYNTVPLPSKIKVSSNYVPLFRVNISTDNSITSSTGTFTVDSVTVTIRGVNNFDPSNDLVTLANNGIALFSDGLVLTDSTNTWNGVNVETYVPCGYNPSTWAVGTSTWSIRLTPSSSVTLDFPNRNYTYYFCVKTSSAISDGNQFKAEIDTSGEVEVTIKEFFASNSTTNLYIYKPTTSAGTTMTADTVAPAFQSSYSPNATSGDTLTIDNTATYNIYSTTDVYSAANNQISIKVMLSDSGNTLSDSVYSMNDLFTLDTTAIDGGVLSNTKTIPNPGAGTEYTISYTVITSTINSPTTALPFRVKVRDAAGNESSWNDSFQLYLDRSKPTAIVPTAPAADSWIGINSPQLIWSGSNDSNLLGYYLVVSTDADLSDFLTNAAGNGWRYFGDNITITNCFWGSSGSWNNYYPVTSTTTVYYWGIATKDKAGNIGLDTGRAFKFDNTSPNIYGNLITGTTTNSQPTISAKIDDAIGGVTMAGIDFSTVTLRINNQIVTIITETVDTTTTTVKYTPTTSLTDGTYTANLWVQDKIGKTNTLSWNFVIDATKPEIKDTDNDAYSDYDETSQNKDPNDSTSKPTSPVDFYPTNNQVVNATEFVNTKKEKIRLRIDDPGSTTGLDLAYSTNSVIVNLLSKGTTEQWISISEVNGSTCAIFYIQLVRTLANNGSDDGVIKITVTPKDSAGNMSNSIARSFIYDNIKPTISTVTIPTTGDTASSLTFTIDAVDVNGLSSDIDAVRLYIYSDTNSPYTLVPSGIANRYMITIPALSEAKTYYYYFYAMDKASNVQYFPSNANSDSSYALPLVISDKTAPQSSIYQIETLLNYRLAVGTTFFYTTTNSGNANVKSLPTVYADPLTDTTNNYNIIRATVPSETTEVVFEYKLSTATLWTVITGNKTDRTVSGNPVWQAYWDTTGLTTNVYYDIRVKSKDIANNSDIPTSNFHSGWVSVYLKPALAPIAMINTTTNFPQDGNFVSGTKLILNANTSATGNISFKEVKFQYKNINEPSTAWKDIATDSDATSATPLTVTMYFNEPEIPYINAFNGIQLSTSIISNITVDELVFGTQYDVAMTKSGNTWSTNLSLPPNTYRFRYKITKPDNTTIILNRDPHEYGNNGTNSQLTINQFGCQWDLTNLVSGQTYQLRCIAKDSLGNADSEPTFISFTYDNIAPDKPIISQPITNQRIAATTPTTIKVALSSSTVNSYVNTMVFECSADSGQNWQTIGGDMNGTNGWSMNWTAPNVTEDTTYLFRVIDWDYPPQISTLSDIVPVLIDATTPQIKSFWVEGTTTTVNLNSGTAYILKATTIDSDIAKLTFAPGFASLITGSFSPDNGVIRQSTGSGTSSDPYTYSCTFIPNNINLTLGTLTATITDLAGNSSAKTINAAILDATPSMATINQINIDDDGDGNYEEDTAGGTDNDGDGLIDEDGFNYVTSGSMMYIGKNTANFSASVTNLDGGTVKFQYATSLSGPWVTFTEVTVAATVTPSWNPREQGIPAGTYYIRALAVDNDNNIDPSPGVIQVTLDYDAPSITSLSTPTGIIDCGKIFSITAQSNNTDISRIVFQYRDPSTQTWTTITNATNLVRLVVTSLTPNAVGGNTATITVSAPNITKATNLDIRAFTFDRAGNRNTEIAYAPISTIVLDDTVAPIATISSVNGPTGATAGQVVAETADASVKSVVFQYRLSGSTMTWTDLAVDNTADTTFGNVGTQWQSGNTLAVLSAGTYDLRAVATDQFNNANADKSPITTVLILNTVAGSRTYSLKKSATISVGVNNVQFGTAGTVTFSLEVKSTVPLTSAPTATLLITDGSAAQNRFTRPVVLSGSGTSFAGNVELTNFGPTNNNASVRITVAGETATGVVYGETAGLAYSVPAQAPAATSVDTLARVTVFTANLNNTTSLFIAPSANTTIPSTQATLLTPIGRSYEFALADGTTKFPAGITATCRLDYTDADISTGGIDESKIGVAYWDTVNQKWSSEGITNVIRDQLNNRATFSTTHFSQFALMLINSVPAITFVSPVSNGYAGVDPIISIVANDSFSGIRAFRIEIDGNDITAGLNARAASDGIDNDGNGLVDEKGGVDTLLTDDEQPITVTTPTSAKFVAKAAIGLNPGKHTMTVTITNQQNISASQNIEFMVGTQLENMNAYNYPNPFAAGKELTTIRFDLTRDAKVSIKIYDFAGNLVSTTRNKESMNAGPQRIEWGGTDDETKRYLANGIYLCRIEADDGTKTVKEIIKIAILR